MLKLIVFVVLMYYILRVAARLFAVIQQDGEGRAQRVPPPGGRSAHQRPRTPPRAGKQPRTEKQPRATRDRPPEDIEDATWEDL